MRIEDFPFAGPLTGLLLQWPNVIEAMPNWTVSPTIDEGDSPQPNWRFLVLRSNTPLAHELDPNSGPFKYPYLLFESENHAILVSSHKNLTEELISIVDNLKVITSPRVDVNNLVKYLSEPKQNFYAIGHIFANVKGEGESLRTMALYGDDLVEARMFKDLIPRIKAFSIELKDVKKAKKGNSILSVGAYGKLSFVYRKEGLREVIETISFLTKLNFIDWSK